jgi:outer membrane protein
MKRFVMMFVGVAFLTGTVMVSLAAAAKIAVIDTAKVVKEYEKTKEAQTRLEKEMEEKKNALKKTNEELEKMQKDMVRQKGIVSEKKYKKLEKKFQDKQDGLREDYRETQTMLMKKQKSLMEDVLGDIRKTVAKVAKSEKIDLVLEKEIALYCNGKDITYKVLDRLNSKKK